MSHLLYTSNLVKYDKICFKYLKVSKNYIEQYKNVYIINQYKYLK